MHEFLDQLAVVRVNQHLVQVGARETSAASGVPIADGVASITARWHLRHEFKTGVTQQTVLLQAATKAAKRGNDTDYLLDNAHVVFIPL
jgi:hypothetical protein